MTTTLSPDTITLTKEQIREAMGRGYEHHHLTEAELLSCLRASFNAERCLVRIARIVSWDLGPSWGPRLEDELKWRCRRLAEGIAACRTALEAEFDTDRRLAIHRILDTLEGAK